MHLYSSVIRLINLHDVIIPPPGGQHAHGAFFEIISQVDPRLSQKLHDLQGKGARKPFTISPIMGLPDHRETSEARNNPRLHLKAGWECWLRVTLLEDILFKSLIDYFTKAPYSNGKVDRRIDWMPKIRLGDAHFLVNEILTTPGSHPWAGFTTVDQLRRILDEPAPEKIVFQFATPTSFKLENDKVELLPYAKFVFGNIASAWRSLTGENIVYEVEKFAENHLRPEMHRYQRKALYLHNRAQLGIVGKVVYDLSHLSDTPQKRLIYMLANFAFYSGVGRKTSQGMGMTRLLTPAELVEEELRLKTNHKKDEDDE